MDERDRLAERFSGERGRLRAVAYRMLGSLDEADDAVQEAWLRADRAGAREVANVEAWLTTIVGRICLDMLRARGRRPESPVDLAELDLPEGPRIGSDPEAEAELADSVGAALLVVLGTLGPDERVAYVLHDMFAVPFAEIAEIVGRTPATAKKLASRARARLHGAPAVPAPELARQYRVVEAFLAASREGDLDALLAVLSPDVVRRRGPALRAELRGAEAVARETVGNRHRARYAHPALIDGAPGLLLAPHGRLLLALRLEITGSRVTEIAVITAPDDLAALNLSLPPR
ncbi:sigma-70 family RNA polymerase sigma factor [Bailinhaonella thermotolerans]|uniref:Sigma-70 family RNA polymerase sigma factor n=1 Tax=Bailinhaonella thermotolerans TaxID=1070861 RepID=A0A3A4A7Y3_9ACTN|nr:sigma-70 family RNA polymerase sigma factor [Bailinhaonella thermotolerans]RJL25136.1 sigma-70 family RNA polymerase sigma factor [Bailinhaonella thermotolerans]